MQEALAQPLLLQRTRWEDGAERGNKGGNISPLDLKEDGKGEEREGRERRGSKGRKQDCKEEDSWPGG